MIKSRGEGKIAGKTVNRKTSCGLKLCPRSESSTEEFRMQILEKTKQAPWQDQGTVRQLQRSLVVKLLSPLIPHLRRR